MLGPPAPIPLSLIQISICELQAWLEELQVFCRTHPPPVVVEPKVQEIEDLPDGCKDCHWYEDCQVGKAKTDQIKGGKDSEDKVIKSRRG